MLGEVAVQAEITGLIQVAGAQLSLALITALCTQTMVVIAAGNLVTRNGLQSSCEEVAELAG
jgi:hypothetical protein